MKLNIFWRGKIYFFLLKEKPLGTITLEELSNLPDNDPRKQLYYSGKISDPKEICRMSAETAAKVLRQKDPEPPALGNTEENW